MTNNLTVDDIRRVVDQYKDHEVSITTDGIDVYVARMANRQAIEVAKVLLSEIDRLKEENERLKNGGWISVKERLPEEDDWYLVFIQTPTEKFVTTERIRGLNANPPDCITHWMPKPEQPGVTVE